MSNLDEPIVPTGSVADYQYLGFSKRERACIDLRIPESGDAELDALIEKARRQELAAKAMEAMIVNAGRNGYSTTTSPRDSF